MGVTESEPNQRSGASMPRKVTYEMSISPDWSSKNARKATLPISH